MRLKLLFIAITFFVGVGSYGQVIENFSTWASKATYTAALSQSGSGGTWTALANSVIVAPSGAVNGTGSIGYVQINNTFNLNLPNIPSGGVGTITLQARFSGANGGFSIEKNINGAGWTLVQAFTSSSTTGVQFQATVNEASSNLQLRINNTGGSGNRVIYVHDVVTTIATTPILATPTATSITTTTATLGATVSGDGGFAITARGTVWGTAAAPTGNLLAEGGTAISSFSHARSGFTANTVYTYRGYAVNSSGTSYSPDANFTTIHNAPNVGSGSGSTSSSIVANWTAPPAAGSATFTYQIEVDDDPAFGSINYIQTSIASGTLSATATGLTSGTTYYFRVRAVNAGGNSAWSSTSVGYATSVLTITTQVNGDWFNAATWVGGVVPTSAQNVIIAHNVTTVAVTRNSGTTTTINTGASLAVSGTYTNSGTTTVNGSFQLDGGGWVSDAGGTNSLVYGSNGTLIFNATYTANNGNYWPTTSGPVNVTVNTSCPLTLGFARTVSGFFQTSAGVINANNLTLNGTNQINTGGSMTGTPTYGASSTLVYNTNSYTTSTNEFPATGVKNVTITAPSLTNTVTLDGDKTITGTLIIGTHTVNGGKSISAATITIGIGSIVAGNITTTTSLTCSGASSISLSGNWSVTGFTKSTSTVNFTNTGNINNATSFFNLTNSGGTRSIIQNIDVERTLLVSGGQMGVSGGTARTLTMSGATAIIDITNGAIYGTDAGTSNDLILIISGAQTTLTGNVSPSFDDDKKFFNVTVNLGNTLILARGILCKYGTFTVNGTLQINANGYVQNNVVNFKSPIYGSASLLKYNIGAYFGRGAEWTAGTGTLGTTAGYPNDIQVTGNTTLDIPNATNFGADPFSTPLALARDLTIDSGSSFYMDYGGNNNKSGTVTVGRNINIAGNLSLGNAIGGDLYVGGTWTRTGTFTPNLRLVTFNGSSAQTLTGDTTFDYLTLNNSSGLTLQALSAVTVNKTLAFTSGKITIGANNLTVGSTGTITGYTSSNYVVTASTGKLVKQGVGNTATDFPIGFSTTNYTPVTLTNTSGTSDLSVSVKQSVTNAVTDATRIVTLEWGVTSSGATTATISPTWVSVSPINQAASFTNTGTGEIGNYTTAYTTYPVTLSTTTTTATGITFQSGTNLIVVGNTGAVYTPPPANDLCGNATTMTQNGTTNAGTTAYATLTSLTSDPYTYTSDVWYKFTANCSGNIKITTATTGMDLDLYAYSTSCPSIATATVSGGFADGSSTTAETMTFAVTSGTIYYIRVGHYSGSANTFTITGSYQAPVVSSASLSGALTTSFSYSIIGTNSPTSYAITSGTLPAGLTLNGTTGVISGTPTALGTSSVSVTATSCGGTSAAATINFTITPPQCINEAFLAGTTTPSGWIFTAIAGTYTSAGNYGIASPSIQFDATNDQVETATISGLAAELSFWIKGQGTDASSSLLVEGYNGSSWETVENISPLPLSGTTKTYNTTSSPALDQSFIKFRFTYTRSAGNIGLDDVIIYCNASCNPPTTQASVFTSSAITPNSATIGWTRGNGNNVLVIAKAVSAVNTDPVSGNSYTADLAFGQGSQLGTGNYVLVSGAVNTANITGLASGTAYHFAVYEWNTTASCYNATQLTGNFTTLPCTSNTISTIFPSSGPVGTEVTITATSGTFIGATAKFNGVSATVLSSSATTLIVKIPTGATTGNLVITNALNCSTSNAYTIINNANTDCQGGTIPGDLFISEVTDETAGSLTYVELYNGTASSINLSTGNYSIAVHNNGLSSATCTISLSGTILPNGVFILALGSSTNAGGVTPNQLSLSCSINNNDNVRLYKNGLQLDQFGYQTNTNLTGIGSVGYTFKRKNTVVVPKLAFLESEWNVIDAPDTAAFGTGTNYTNVGFYTPLSGTPPTVSLPTNVSTCKTTSLTIIGTEGYNEISPADAKELNYQWYVSAPNVAAWTKIIVSTDGSVYTNFMSATLNISNNSGLTNYQYYCQISEDSNTCYVASNAVKITDGTITWNGTDWRDVNNVIATPTIDKLVIINADYDTSATGLDSFSACSVIVNNGKFLTVTANKFVKIQNDLTNNGTLDIDDKGSLIQVNDSGVNTGNITYNRTTPSIFRTDYTYWSSPVVGYTLGGVSQNLTLSDKYYSYDSTIEDWKQESSATVMSAGKGYIIRGPETPFQNPFDAFFIGKPNNGIYTITGVTTNKSYLLGNPYPSALDADTFLNDNSGVLDGTLYFWTHKTPLNLAANITNPGPGWAYTYSLNDYAAYNLTGGVGIDDTILGPGGYAAPNGSSIPTGKIASGQGFFGSSKASSLTGSTIVYNNSMRVGVIDILKENNSQFFKSRSPKNKIAAFEKHRIWLNLTNTQGAFKQTLVGYITNATNEYDSRFDGESYDGHEFVDFYSVNQNKNLVIQGRALPFNENDEVPLGFRTTIEGAFTIKVDQADGVLTNQSIFIEDKLTNTIFDLKTANYTFNTVAGTFNERFVLRYTNKTLSNKDFETLENQVLVSNKNKQIKVNSTVETIDKVTVYDLLGRQIFKKEKVNSNELTIPNLVSSQQTLLIKVSLQNGQSVTKKIIY